jgi:sulfate adenylyltransferase
MELLAREIAGPHAAVEFASAGTHGFRDHPMDEVMAGTLAPRGVDGSGGFRSRALTAEMVERADLVLTAEAAHRTFILDDHPGSFRKVFTLGQFAEAVRVADPALTGRALLEVVGERRGAADASLDVDDPYSRGPEAAATSARLIEDRVRAVLSALLGAK